MKENPEHLVDNAFDVNNVPMHKNIYGTHRIVQTDVLHTIGNGLYKILISIFFYMIGIKNKNKSHKNFVIKSAIR